MFRVVTRRALLQVARMIVLIAIAILVANTIWKRGSPFGKPCYSPNHDYYVQRYQNLNLIALLVGIGMPGQGSDSFVGYSRLYDRKGKLMHEIFGDLVHGPSPLWLDTEVTLYAGNDYDVVQLPTTVGEIPIGYYGDCY